MHHDGPMHDSPMHDGTTTAGRKGIPYDWQALVAELEWEQITAALHDLALDGALAILLAQTGSTA